MDLTSDTLFDNAIHSNFLNINLGQEDPELGGLCAYDDNCPMMDTIMLLRHGSR
jgi:hypothetical protein